MKTGNRLSDTVSKVESKSINANVTLGVMEQLRNYFFKYPNSNAKHACRVLKLPHKRYGNTARVVKYRVWKTWGGANVKGDLLKSLTSVHRQKLYLKGGVPYGPVLQVIIDAAKGNCNRDNVWFSANNRNGQLNYRSPFLALRLFPSSRNLEVFCRDPSLDGLAIREKFEVILYSTLQGCLPVGYDASHIAKDLSWKLAPKERHRTFEVPSFTDFWKVRYYEDMLGLIIQRDGSEGVNELEVIEKTPPWILELIQAIIKMAEVLRSVKCELQQLKNVIADLSDNRESFLKTFRKNESEVSS